MQNNQLPTKSPIELKDISAVLPASALPAITYQGWDMTFNLRKVESTIYR